MPNPEHKPAKKPGVSSLWRTATVCMLAGMAMHWWVAAQAPEPKEQGLTVSGDPLPPEWDYDPRLDQVLEAVDLDNVPMPDALTSITRRAGINIVLTEPVLTGHDWGMLEPPKITLHLKNAKVVDALNAVYGVLQGAPFDDVRNDWSESGGVLYTTSQRIEPLGMFTRVYNVKTLLDRHDQVSSLTTEPSTDHNAWPIDARYSQRNADWLAAIIGEQVLPHNPFGSPDNSACTFFEDKFIVTATAAQHRMIARILRELAKQE